MHLSGIMGILIILTTILLADLSTTLDIKKINATFNTTVSLPCEKPCRGDVKWIKVRPVPFRTTAICKNGLCTVKEKDFENRATPILSGNISLLLQQVALGDEGWYEGYCDDKVICDITLSLLPHHKSVSVLVGDPLIINLLSSEPVRVTFRKAGLSNSTDKLICIVEEAVPLCVREYTRCSAQSHFVMFADVTQSDVGVFTVTHSKTKRIFNTVNVAVKDDYTCLLCATPGHIILVVVAFILTFFFWHIIAFAKRTCGRIANRVRNRRKRHPTPTNPKCSRGKEEKISLSDQSLVHRTSHHTDGE